MRSVVPSKCITRRDTQPASAAQPEDWVNKYGDALFRHAMIRLRDSQLAEDLVQETFLAAWKGRDRFRGNSSEKTWLFAILRNKIVDHLRRVAREIPLSELESLETHSFQREGWHKDVWNEREAPRHWPNAREALHRHEFWRILQACLEKMPPNTARAFILREMDTLDAKDVCEVLNISHNHLWVVLHRARLALRSCLEKNWFENEISAVSPSSAS